MANLIVTIFGILLAAVLAIAGIFYGGGVFQDYLASAKANEILQNLQLLKSAANAWRVNNSGNAYPATDPRGGAACSTIGSASCWYSNLTYNRVYLQTAYPYCCIADWWAPLNLWQYGVGGASGGGGYFAQFYIRITPDTLNQNFYAAWYASPGGSWANPNASLIDVNVFLTKVCQNINKQLGIQLGNPNYNFNTNNITGTSIPFNLPYASGSFPPVTGSSLTNVCFIQGGGVQTYPSFYVFIPL